VRLVKTFFAASTRLTFYEMSGTASRTHLRQTRLLGASARDDHGGKTTPLSCEGHILIGSTLLSTF
jgi:hypothetical protein